MSNSDNWSTQATYAEYDTKDDLDNDTDPEYDMKNNSDNDTDSENDAKDDSHNDTEYHSDNDIKDDEWRINSGTQHNNGISYRRGVERSDGHFSYTYRDWNTGDRTPSGGDNNI
jgi:hypothetical protein